MSDQTTYLTGLGIAVAVAYTIFRLNLSALFVDLAAIPIPVFLSFKATQTNDPRDDTQWLMYWSVFGLLRLLDYADGVLHLIPLYNTVKVGFIVWLWFPWTRGATTLYQKFISPFLQKNQQRIDSGLSIVGQRMEETAQQALNAAGSQVLRERLRTNSQGQM